MQSKCGQPSMTVQIFDWPNALNRFDIGPPNYGKRGDSSERGSGAQDGLSARCWGGTGTPRRMRAAADLGSVQRAASRPAASAGSPTQTPRPAPRPPPRHTCRLSRLLRSECDPSRLPCLGSISGIQISVLLLGQKKREILSIAKKLQTFICLRLFL